MSRPSRLWHNYSLLTSITFAVLLTPKTSSLGYKLEKLRFRTDIGRYWFTNRVANNCNRLDRHVISAESIGSFKRRSDESMDRDDRWDG